MTPNNKFFCNSPWYELQIYWDGSLGFCCQESHKMYPPDQDDIYNVKNMTISQWFDSPPMRQARLDMFNDKENSFCQRCYIEENLDGSSRRHRSNQKSVIFTRSNFKESYLQSPGYDKFENTRNNDGKYDGMPIDLHIDLGNYCNLACKMCNPKSSSNIAVQHVRWGIKDARQYVGTDWTKNQAVWDRVLSEISGIEKLKNIHFMGGETLITKKFEDFVDYMIDKKRFDLNFSFVTNGTTFNQSLMEKLLRFNRIGIEVSIESLTDHNKYQRQGTDTTQVLKNIDRYRTYCINQQIALTARPAISLLTIGSYYTLLEYCLQHSMIVKSLVCYRPGYYDARILPRKIKELYLERYQEFLTKFDLHQVDCSSDYNESDPNQIKSVIKNQVLQSISLLNTPRPPDADLLLEQMVRWCKRWDEIYGYDARQIYPEFCEIFDQYGY